MKKLQPRLIRVLEALRRAGPAGMTADSIYMTAWRHTPQIRKLQGIPQHTPAQRNDVVRHAVGELRRDHGYTILGGGRGRAKAGQKKKYLLVE